MTQMMDRNPNKDTQKIRRDTTQKWLYDNPGKTLGRSGLIYFFLTAARKALNKNNITELFIDTYSVEKKTTHP